MKVKDEERILSEAVHMQSGAGRIKSIECSVWLIHTFAFTHVASLGNVWKIRGFR